MLITRRVVCPYCGESYDTGIDASAGQQQYIEDCYVCCHPIEFFIGLDHSGKIVSVVVKRDQE